MGKGEGERGADGWVNEREKGWLVWENETVRGHDGWVNER